MNTIDSLKAAYEAMKSKMDEDFRTCGVSAVETLAKERSSASALIAEMEKRIADLEDSLCRWNGIYKNPAPPTARYRVEIKQETENWIRIDNFEGLSGKTQGHSFQVARNEYLDALKAAIAEFENPDAYRSKNMGGKR